MRPTQTLEQAEAQPLTQYEQKFATAASFDEAYDTVLGNCSMWFKGSSKDKYPNFCDTCVGYMQARRVTDIRSSKGLEAGSCR